MELRKVESKRTFKDIITVALAETHHWQLLCDLSDNDYDISYFDGKVVIADNFVTFLRSIEDEFYLQEVAEYLYKEIKNVNRDEFEYEQNNGCMNENYIGALEELRFLLNYCYKEYCHDY